MKNSEFDLNEIYRKLTSSSADTVLACNFFRSNLEALQSTVRGWIEQGLVRG